MRLLLDTQAFLYAILDSPALPPRARALVESLENELFLSIASVWEMAIKVGLGKLTLEERATCPASCHAFDYCYGNSMHYARRVKHGTRFELRLIDEVAALADQHRQGFVIRLHVLGDFYSEHYAKVWTELLARVPALRVYGYTARALNGSADSRTVCTST